MSNRMKKKSGAGKYLALIIVLIILVIAFYTFNKEDDTNINNNPTSNQSNNENVNNNLSNDDNNQNSNNNEGININTNVNNNEGTNINNEENNNDNETILGGTEIINSDTYTLYDTYVIASDKTQYGQSGYKYFIVRSYSQYEQYIGQNLLSPFDDTYVSQFDEINSQTLNNIKANISKEYFKNSSLLFVVDYSTKEINGKISNVQVSENEVTLNIDRTVETDKTSKYITYIVPIELTSIKSVAISYIR